MGTPSKNSKSLDQFLDRVTIGLGRSQTLLDSITNIKAIGNTVVVVAVPKHEDLVDSLQEELVDTIRELPEQERIAFRAKAQKNVIGGRTHLFIRLYPEDRT